MIRRQLLAILLLLPAALLQGAVQFSAGASPGLALPFSGNISNYQPAFAPGIDLRVTGVVPVMGMGLNAGYAEMIGPYRDSLRRDSSSYSYRYVPVAITLFTDFSPLMTNPPVTPYLSFGAGPTYWEIRRNGDLFMVADSTQSRQWNYVMQGTLGVEKRLGKVPLSVFLEATADYVAGSDFERYGYSDEDDVFAEFRLGLRYYLN